MSKLFLSLAFGGAVALMAFNAEAFPSAPLSSTYPSSDVIQVAGGCGPGWQKEMRFMQDICPTHDQVGDLTRQRLDDGL